MCEDLSAVNSGLGFSQPLSSGRKGTASQASGASTQRSKREENQMGLNHHFSELISAALF